MVTGNGFVAGRYQIDRWIGGGATGDVFAGTDKQTGETVAIKQLRREVSGNIPEIVQRFLREGEALRRLNHPNIVKILATVDECGMHYIVMEYVSGGSLADLLENQPQVPLGQIVTIGLELSDALSRAHHLHILHRDIKPANILLAEDGTPRLTDFGLAHIGGMASLTEAGSILGTLYYLSPEGLENQKIDERSDIWSLGAVMFEMITGRRPFEGETPFEVIWAIKNQSLPKIEFFRPDVPPQLNDLVKRMLRKDSPARVSSMREVGVELEKIQKEINARSARISFSGPPLEQQPEDNTKIRVLIIDDHAVVRQGLRTFIDLQRDMEVVGEGSDGIEAVDLAVKIKPDIILLDLVMPKMDGVQATSEIRMVLPQARIIILTSFGEDDKVIPAIRAGAQGYLLKNIKPEDLVQAVREAYQGKVQLHPEIAEKLMSIVSRNHQSTQETKQKEETDTDSIQSES